MEQKPTDEERQKVIDNVLLLRKKQLSFAEGFIETTIELKGDMLLSELLKDIKERLKEDTNI